MTPLRAWLAGPTAPAVAGLAALVIAAALAGTWVSIRTGLPAANVASTMLLVLMLGGSYITTLLLPRRPVTARAAVPVEAPTAPGTRVPASLPGWCEAGTLIRPRRSWLTGRRGPVPGGAR